MAHRARIVRLLAGGALMAGLVLQSAMAQEATATAALSPAIKQVTLDLRPPKITDLYSPSELARLLSNTFDPSMEEIEVEGVRPVDPVTATPDIPGGLGAVFWAVVNPAQAWRILAPLPPDRANALAANVRVDDMPYLSPAAVRPRNISDSP